MPISSLGDLTPHSWFKADAGVLEAISGSDAAEDGDGVERWEDQSGNARHADQATSSKRPTFHTNVQNSLPGVLFDGVDDGLATASFTSEAQPFTLVALIQVDVTPPASIIRPVDWTGSGRLQVSTANAVAFNAGTSLSGGVNSGLMVVVGVANGTSSKIRINGTETTGDAGTAPFSRIGLGANVAATGNFFDKYLFEVAFFDYELTSTNITDAEAHLNSKWFPPPVAPLPRVYGRVARQRAAVM